MAASIPLPQRWRQAPRVALLMLCTLMPACAQGGVTHVAAPIHVTDLRRMSLSQLASLEVTSVSKEPAPVRDAAAAVYVITRQDIRRSGATSLPEALRLAPNLLVTQFDAANYAVSARGLGGNPDVQSFANKLLVLIDGRSVYSPLFSGIYFDAQDVMLEDVERIEVISGPGATLWGANAMHGVVNVITRHTLATRGTLAALGAGNREVRGSVRHGGQYGDELSYRVYGQAFRRGETEAPGGRANDDDWHRGQGGVRLDWSRGRDDVNLQADLYRGRVSQGDTGWLTLDGSNVLSRWQRATPTGQFQLQAYYDETTRDAPGNTSRFTLRTYDLEAQHSVDLGARQRLVWGGGYRINDYAIGNTAALSFVPDERGLTIANLFAQDTITLTPSLHLSLGMKLENHTYTDWVAQPDVRLAWRVRESMLLWTAVSRAIRSPTPFDRDVEERVGGRLILTGNRAFEPEALTAWEVGYRGRPWRALSVEATLFVHDYEDLRTIEAGSTVPLTWKNGLAGQTYGVQAWARWELTSWWRVSPGVTLLRKRLDFDDGAQRLVGTTQAGNDPSGHGTLTSSMDLGDRLDFDATLRHVGRLEAPAFDAYTELNARLGWQAAPGLDIALVGQNLLHEHHQEYPAPQGQGIGRSVFVQMHWSLP